MRRACATATLTGLVTLLLVLPAGCGRAPSSTTPVAPRVGAAGSAAPSPAQRVAEQAEPLFLYCGAGLRKPFEELNQAFAQDTGITVEPTFTGSGCPRSSWPKRETSTCREKTGT